MFKSKGYSKELIKCLEKQKTDNFLDINEWSTYEKISLACRILYELGHSSGLSGQITARIDSDRYITQPFGRGFDQVSVSMLLTVDADLNILAGIGSPNPANRFHSWIYHFRTDVNCIIHTHAKYSSALSMLGVPLRISHIDCCALYDDVAHLKEWPGIPIGNSEGEIIAKNLENKSTILLSHHGLLTVGSCIEEAVYLAIQFENAAQLQLLSMAAGNIQDINPALAREARDWLRRPYRINATFQYYANRILRSDPSFLD